MMRVSVITSTRADYVPLRPLIMALLKDDYFCLDLIVMGTHFVKEFGETVKEINDDGIPIHKCIDTFSNQSDADSVSKESALSMMEFSSYLADSHPDMVVILGDRSELLPITLASNIHQVPVAHISGGEVTHGSLDDSVRHALTKLSHFHFVSMTEYQNRVLQLGEPSDRVFVVGELGLDNLNDIDYLSKKNLEESIGHRLGKINILVAFHPDSTKPLEDNLADFDVILQELLQLRDVFILFTAANADVGGTEINHKIKEFVDANRSISHYIPSLGRHRFYSVLSIFDLFLGNSSSGIWEAPSFGIPVINIGERQKGRVCAEGTISVSADKNKIKEAYRRSQSRGFREKIRGVVNPYGDSHSAQKIVDILKSLPPSPGIKKIFKDLDLSN